MLHAHELFSSLFPGQEYVFRYALIGERRRNQDAVYIDTREQRKELLQLFGVRVFVDGCVGTDPETLLLCFPDSLNSCLECPAPTGYTVVRLLHAVEMEVEA